MADNIPVTPGTGATIAADDIGGVLHQRVKLALGADGINDGDVSATNPMPTAIVGTVPVSGTFYQATQPVSGTVSVSGAVAVTGPLTDTQLRATAVPVSLSSTTVTNTVAVSGSFFQATQPVSAASLPLPTGASTSANQTTAISSLSSLDTKTPALGQALAAASTPVVLTAAQLTTLTPLSTVAVTGPLTDAQLRASFISVNTEGTKATYSAAVVGLVAANTASDIFTITGSATKTIRITRLAFTGTQTTGAQRDVVILKRSTANTAGTSSAPNKVAHDSTSAAATATVLSYTANPTVGTLIGNIRTRKVLINATTANSDEYLVDFVTGPHQAPILRGTGEVLAVNLNGVTSAGNLLDISITWTEE
jgi:hypothetical protein